MEPVSASGPLADRFERSRFGVEDGLPQASVLSMAEDADGYLYLGTFGGLARYDGARFVVLGADRGVPVRVTALASDPTGQVWVGSQYGEVVKLPPRERAVPVDVPALRRSTVWGFELSGPEPVVLTSRAVWTATASGGWSDRAVHDARSLVRAGPHLLVATLDGLVDESGARVVDTPTSDVVVDGAGGVWSVGQGGLAAPGAPARALGVTEQVPTQILLDRRGRVWVAGGRDLIVWEDVAAANSDRTATVFELDSPVRELFLDRAGAVWVGTDGEGVVRFVEHPFRRFGSVSAAFLEAGDDPRWGADCRVHGPEGAVPDPTAGCVSSLLRSAGRVVHADHDGRVYVDGELVDDVGASVIALADDPGDAGAIWVGTDGGGAWHGRPGALEPVPGLEGEVISVVAPDAAGAVWFGTIDGAAALGPDGLARYGPSRGVHGQVRAVWFDPEGGTWLGTYGGGLVYVGEDGVTTTFGLQHGLRELVVSSLVADLHGWLWANGNRGLSALSLADLRGVVDGTSAGVRAVLLPTGEGNGGASPAGGLAPDGAVWIPTIHGAVRVDPADLPRGRPALRPVVEEVRTSDGTFEYPSTVTTAGSVEVRFTAPASDAMAVEFRYRVRPSPSTGWTPLGNARSLAVVDLAVGDYLVEIQARGASGGWSEPAVLVLDVRGHWSDLPFVRVTVPFAVVSLALTVALWRTRVNRERAAALEREVAKRAELEEGLRSSEAHYRKVFEAATNPLVVVDRDGVVREANPAATAMYGGTADLCGVAAKTLFVGDTFVTHEGAAVPVQVRSVDIGDRELRTIVDLTTLDDLQHRLVDTERADVIGRTAGTIAHEFNNLLAVIRSNAHELHPVVDGTPQAEALQHVEGSAERGAELIRQLLAVGRRQILEPETLELGRVLRAVDLRLRRLKPQGVRTQIRCDRGLTVRADARQLELVLTTLLLHATQRAAPAGEVMLSSTRFPPSWVHARWGVGADRDWVVTTLVDDGPSLPPSVTARLFEPFVEDPTRPGGALGFSAIHGFASQSGGHLFVRSESGRGTSFDLLLPWVEDLPAATPVPAPSTPKRLRVVVVDDEPLVRRALVRMLEAMGHHVRSAESGSECLDLLREEQPQVLVSDVLMPVMSGPELVARVRRQFPQVAVVYVTAYAQEHSELDAPVVAKPFQRADLERALVRAVQRWRG